jgi:23S rRNA G2445 N2-methylase RlmL
MPLSLVARCVRGTEWILADEVAALGDARRVRLGEREVTFGVERLTSALLGLATADDLFLSAGDIEGIGSTRAALPVLAGRLAGLDVGGVAARLRALRPLPRRPRFDVVASLAGRRTYNRYAVEDTAGAALRGALGPGYVSRNPAGGGAPVGPTDLTVRLFLHGERVQVALRVAARPLHRRAWKQHTGAGTLHPPAAAALARLAGAPEHGTLLDPFCGDGTIAVELARLAPAARTLASDLAPERLAGARANAAAAAVPVSLLRTDAGRLPLAPGTVDRIVTNPPWNRAVGAAGAVADGLLPLWGALPRVLAPGGRLCLVTEAELGVDRELRRAGYTVPLAQGVRLAGRVAQFLVAYPPGAEPGPLAPGLLSWRARALKYGVVTEDGF